MQGGSISPLLANIYLHYVFDLWVHRWRTRHAHGEVVVVRFADDFVVGFEHREEAERFLAELRERFARFGLALHPDKTRLIEFGRHADRTRRGRGDGKPETFNFLGFTHTCSQDAEGTVYGAARNDATEVAGQAAGSQDRTAATPARADSGTGSLYARRSCSGHARDYGVPRNGPSLSAFRFALVRRWRAALQRRSQTARVSWARMTRLVNAVASRFRAFVIRIPTSAPCVSDPRQEPDAVIPHVRICAGGAG